MERSEKREPCTEAAGVVARCLSEITFDVLRPSVLRINCIRIEDFADDRSPTTVPSPLGYSRKVQLIAGFDTCTFERGFQIQTPCRVES